MKTRVAVTLSFFLASAPTPMAIAQDTPSSQIFAIPQTGITFLTGDSWTQGSQTMRLYGIQSCLRGTSYTDHADQRQDCGAISLAMLAALIRDTRPTCSPIAQLPAPAGTGAATILVICSAHVGNQALDLGTVLVTQGFAFAAFANDKKPVYMPYLVAEDTAKQAKAGLWAYQDMPHPNTILFGAMRDQTKSK